MSRKRQSSPSQLRVSVVTDQHGNVQRRVSLPHSRPRVFTVRLPDTASGKKRKRRGGRENPRKKLKTAAVASYGDERNVIEDALFFTELEYYCKFSRKVELFWQEKLIHRVETEQPNVWVLRLETSPTSREETWSLSRLPHQALLLGGQEFANRDIFSLGQWRMVRSFTPDVEGHALLKFDDEERDCPELRFEKGVRYLLYQQKDQETGEVLKFKFIPTQATRQ